MEIDFDEKQIQKIFQKINIPIDNTKVTVFGGFTGHFSKCLRNLGMKVIFTDPIKEWVLDAKESGFEAYQYSAEEIPNDLIQKTDLFATFECYPPFLTLSTILYTALRFLTTKLGILFVASIRTYSEMVNEYGKGGRMKYYFLPFKKVYDSERLEKGKQGLKFYHFYSTNENQLIKLDCRLIKALYENYPNEVSINKKNVAPLVEAMTLTKDEVVMGLKRILKLYKLKLDTILKPYTPENSCRLFYKIFYINL